MILTDIQVADYQRDGFLVLRGAIDDDDIRRVEAGLARNPPLDGTLEKPRYPEPGRYTLANNCLKDPDLAFLAEHPVVIAGATTLLGDHPRLTAYVIYDRTPGGPGLPPHHDYKRWRPVGSSMNWLFTIVPFCDFDERTGRLFVAPGSHHLERVHRTAELPLDVAPAIRPDDAEFVDPGLERGDLLFMNMHLWHRADGNTSDRHRVGAFNKYAAADAPPATGYFLYDDDVFAALSERGRSILAVHDDRPVATTRALLTRGEGAERQVLLVPDGDGWQLPGGRAVTERAIPDWDQGNFIASLDQHLREQVHIETPWVSYIGDFVEDAGLCRVYGYHLNDHGFPVKYAGRWMTVDELRESAVRGYEYDAFDRWRDPTIVRGKGLAQARCRIDQFAY